MELITPTFWKKLYHLYINSRNLLLATLLLLYAGSEIDVLFRLLLD